MKKHSKNFSEKNRICFVIAYFGELPIWFPAFFVSCKLNTEIDWLIFTDANELPSYQLQNVKFKELSFLEFKSRAAKTIDSQVEFINPHKLCDFKPIYGDIFQDELHDYQYWGHSDIDLIWGDIKPFLDKINFGKYHVISSRKLTICGHFTLYQNSQAINTLYRKVKGYKKIFVQESYSGFDEGFFSYYLYQESLKINSDYNIFWPKKHAVDWPELDFHPNGWYWSNGKIYGNDGRERLYLHFMKWKKSMKSIDFESEDMPTKFLISQNGIWSQPMKIEQKLVYFFPNHFWRLLHHYFKRLRNRIGKNAKLEEPLIPDGYKIID